MNSISIVVPSYNEEARLPATLATLRDFLGSRSFEFVEVLVVDDGSRDGTARLVEQWAESNPSVRLLRNPGNRGKGYSVRHGMLEAKGAWRLFTDADLSTPIEELDKLQEAAAAQEAHVAFGSRALDRSLVGIHQSGLREAAGRVFNLLMRCVTGLPYSDTQCGFKLYRADAAGEIFLRQQLDGFGFDVEDLFLARRLGFRAVEVPVRWNNVEGTKVSMSRGLDAFADLARIRAHQLAGRYR